MLHILLGTDWRANQAALLQALCDKAKQAVSGQILLVPEQFSHAAERRLCSLGGDTISRYAEVLSFSRLAARVFSVCGGVAELAIDNGGRLLCAAAAVEQVQSRLKLYGALGKKPEFLLQLLDSLDACKSFRITADMLRDTAAQLTGLLAQKLEELALLSESYEAVCANRAQDASTRLAKLLDRLRQCDYADGRCFYIDGFADFNTLELEILGVLLETGKELTISLFCDTLEDGAAVFDDVRRTANSLIQLAKQLQVPVRLTQIPPLQTEPSLAFVREQLFSPHAQAYSGSSCAVELFSAKDAYEEAVAAAGRILQLVRSGCRYRQIAVACSDISLYRPVLQAVFARAQIPAYFAGNTDILSKPVIRTVLSALEAVTNSMQAEAVFAYLKSGLQLLTPDACDRLENYVLTWNISGAQWAKRWQRHPDGYGKEADEQALAALDELNCSRALAAAPLLHLQKALFAAQTTGQQLLALYDFLEEIQFSDRLQRIAERCTREGKLQRAQEYAQLYRILCMAMEQMYELLEKTLRSPEEFVRLLRAMLRQYDVGTIPATLDSVSVGSILSMRQSEVENMLVLGACDGLFPAQAEPSGLLSETERRKLRAMGLPLAPGQAEKLTREEHAILNVITAPQKLLYLSSIREQEAYLFKRLQQLLPFPEKQPAPLLYYSTEDALVYLSGLSRADPAAAAALARSIPGGEELLRGSPGRFDPGGLHTASIRALYGKPLALSASRVDCYSKCRCQYFLKYGLRAKARKQASFDAASYGTLAHAVLEKTARAVVQAGGFSALDTQAVVQLAQKYMDEYTRQTIPEYADQPERFTYLYARNMRELSEVVADLHQELRQSGFVPSGFEVVFSAASELEAVSVHGQSADARLSGKVDRIDLYRRGETTYARVIDYKTGVKGFDYTDILDGIGMQLLIYLFALEAHGRAKDGTQLAPGGVLYFPARLDLLHVSTRLSDEAAKKERLKSRKRDGLLLKDEQILRAMEDAETPVFMPYEYKKGTLSGELASMEDFALLRRFVTKTLAAIADGIAGGEVQANPIYRDERTNACRFCDYAEVCHVRSGSVKKRIRKKVNQEEFWKEVEARTNG